MAFNEAIICVLATAQRGSVLLFVSGIANDILSSGVALAEVQKSAVGMSRECARVALRPLLKFARNVSMLFIARFVPAAKLCHMSILSAARHFYHQYRR